MGLKMSFGVAVVVVFVVAGKDNTVIDCLRVCRIAS